MYSGYKYLRPVAVLAGILGVLQSLTWIAMAITGIVAYYCHLDFSNISNTLGSLFELTFFQVYFKGPCDELVIPNVDFTVLNNLNLLDPIDVHAMMWVYMMLSFFWLISSFILITNVTADYIKYANIFLYIWIFITVALSIIDLGLGIMFGLDYETFMFAGYGVNLDTGVLNDAILLSGQVAAGTMMTVAFRGFILWLINVALAIYLFTQTFKIYDYNKMKVHNVLDSSNNNNNNNGGIDNVAFSHEPHSIHRNQPIDAYGFNLRQNPTTWNNNVAAPRPERTRSLSASSMYDDRDRRRQNHMSTYDNHPQLRRRDDDVALRRDAASVAREINDRNSYNPGRNRNEPHLPAPDYSPPMPRVNPYDNRQPLRSALRNSRF